MKKIFVTKTFVPPLKQYQKYLKDIFDTKQLTNQGKHLHKLESNLKTYLNVKNIHCLANGTLALQLAIRALDITDGEIITTPFSYVATISAILWERCTPVFVDIEKDNFTIDTNKIEQAITNKTKAILAVHVFGYTCNIEKINKIAKKYNLKVIYDGAHTFGTRYKMKSLLDYGDISTCSFHATKLFHTVEGGCCITKDKKLNSKLELLKRFGHNYDNHVMLGINAKLSELHSVMGLVNLQYIDKIIKEREKISLLYDKFLNSKMIKPKKQKHLEYNYSYYPILLESENKLLKILKALNKNEIYPRRYFYPSLNTLPYITKKYSCPISEDISKRILCLPLYVGLTKQEVTLISEIINKNA